MNLCQLASGIRQGAITYTQINVINISLKINNNRQKTTYPSLQRQTNSPLCIFLGQAQTCCVAPPIPNRTIPTHSASLRYENPLVATSETRAK